jgi:hypothetical protein
MSGAAAPHDRQQGGPAPVSADLSCWLLWARRAGRGQANRAGHRLAAFAS